MKAPIYPFIRVWGLNMGSHPGYIDEQVLRAKNENAPPRAAYKEVASGVWITIDEIQNLDLKNRMERAVAERYPTWGAQ